MMRLEDQLSDALRSAAEQVTPPPGLAEGGLRRARRHRRHRTVALIGSASVVVAGCLAAVTLLPGPAAHRQAPATRPAPSRPAVAPADMITKLERLLPPGRRIRPQAGSDPHGLLFVGLTYDGGTGPHRVMLTIQRPDDADTGLTRCLQIHSTPGSFCTATPRPGGFTLVLRNGYANPLARTGDTGLFAYLVRPGHLMIILSVTDRPDAGSRSALSPSDLRTVITSPVWTDLARFLPTAGPSTTTSPG